MKRLSLPIWAGLVFSMPLCAQAGIVDYPPVVQTFQNKDCKKTESCDLKSFQVSVGAYEVHFSDGDTTYGNEMFASYETRGVTSLEKFGIVQFLRGCVFASRFKNGKVVKTIETVYPLMGNDVPFQMTDWVVDSYDSDPLYGNGFFNDKSRFWYYRWNSVPGSFAAETETYYGVKKPTRPVLYVHDLPSVATYMNPQGVAKNLSLELRTCIYKTSDIPQELKDGQTDFAKPIHCFEWRNSRIYDFQLGRFDAPQAIDPFCGVKGD